MLVIHTFLTCYKHISVAQMSDDFQENAGVYQAYPLFVQM